MVRGGGAGGGGALVGQLFNFLGGLASLPFEELLRLGLGLLLMIVIISLIVRTPPARVRPAIRSTTCLICGQPLPDRTYIDRHSPNWVACGTCYDRLTPRQQRQYRTR